jgi:hypothetical protein
MKRVEHIAETNDAACIAQCLEDETDELVGQLGGHLVAVHLELW